MIEAVGAVAAVAGALFLVNLIVSRAFGVSLLCHLGLHRWHKVEVGRGRDTRYVVKCKACEMLREEG